MSGGSLDYVYHRINDAVDTINSRPRLTPLHRAFSKHLEKVSKALHDLEWAYSGDYDNKDAEAAIRAVVGPQDEIVSAREEAEVAIRNLKEILESTRSISGN